MKIYDISQEVFGCAVFPGDPRPERKVLSSMKGGDCCNLTAFSMCAHNGTHIDAPYHFVENGKAVEALSLSSFIGLAYVAECHGVLGADEVNRLLAEAKKKDVEAARRILIKGDATLSLEGAEALVQEGVVLFGNESQTVGPEEAPMAVHQLLLGAEVVLLEGIRLQEVPEGVYLLSAAPLCLKGADGAPCRALLIASSVL